MKSDLNGKRHHQNHNRQLYIDVRRGIVVMPLVGFPLNEAVVVHDAHRPDGRGLGWRVLLDDSSYNFEPLRGEVVLSNG